MNKQEQKELTNKVIEGLRVPDRDKGVRFGVGLAIFRLDELGWLRNPGEPIDPADIREGDRVRIEYSDGDEREWTAKRDVFGTAGDKFFLLDRPKPELPTEPGAMIRTQDGELWVMDRIGVWHYGKAYANTSEYFDNIDWEVVA